MYKKLIRTDRSAFFGLLGVIILTSDLYIENAMWSKLRLVLAFVAVALALYFATKDRKFEDEKYSIFIGISIITLTILSVVYMVFKFDIV